MTELDEKAALIDQLLHAQAVAGVGSWTWFPEPDTVTWSPELYRIVGRQAESFTPTYVSVLDCLHPDDRSEVEAIVDLAVATSGALRYSARIVRPDGTIRRVESEASPAVPGAIPVRYVGTVLDVTDRFDANAVLRESEARVRSLMELTREGIWSVDADGRTTYVNSRLAEMLGYQVEEIMGRSLFAFLDEEGQQIAAESLGRQRVDGIYDRLDFRFIRRDGTELWTLISGAPILDAEGAYAGSLAMLTDITERKAAEQNFAHAATHDGLTGLPNRVLFIDRLEVALARGTRSAGKLAVLFCDLDHFKFINDSLGHIAGDEVLAAVAARLVAAVRPGDTVARIGGDEFVMCCQDLEDVAAAELIADRVARTLAKPVMLEGREIFVTVSIGIRIADAAKDTPGDLLRDADTAMYQAKAAGRAGCSVFDDTLRERAELRLEVESGLHRALERGELRVHYQPTMFLDGSGIAGVEALVRWQAPDRGLRPPGDFIGIAEETGMIVPIGLWVLTESCRQLCAWNERGSGRLEMAVNVSPRQLRSPDLVDQVSAILANTGVNPSHLCLEITEGALMHDPAAAEQILRSLKGLGLRLAIDDFGTGYSSLSYLRRFPIDVLKIDRSFVSQLGIDPESTAIVTSVIHLAKSLDLEVVAEGIETTEQLAQLELLGCPRAQGYYWSRAVPAEEIERKLKLTPPVAHRAPIGPITVLVADDDAQHRALVTRILRRGGQFTVVAEATDGQDAIDLAEQERPDLVVLDLSMPRMDGLEALPRILALSPGTKVALLSGHIGSAPLARGASVHLRKGMHPDELVEHLLLVMGRTSSAPGA